MYMQLHISGCKSMDWVVQPESIMFQSRGIDIETSIDKCAEECKKSNLCTSFHYNFNEHKCHLSMTFGNTLVPLPKYVSGIKCPGKIYYQQDHL